MHPHVHFLINHFPIIGNLLAIGILVAGFYLKNNTVKNVALALFFVTGLSAIPSYFTGEAAFTATQSLDWFEKELVETHGKAGFWAMIWSNIVGLIAAGALYASAKDKPFYPKLTIAVLVLSFVVAATMYRAGDTGGEIRHLELRHE